MQCGIFFMKTSIPRMYKEEMENENKRKAMVINDCGGQVNGIEKGVKPVQAKIQKHREYLTKKVEQNLQNKNGVSLHRMDRLAKLRAMIFDLAEQAINELWDNVAEIEGCNLNTDDSNQLERTISSLEIAEMVGREHRNVMQDIRKISEHLGELKSQQSYFIESTYTNTQNKKQYCYNFKSIR